MKLNHFLVLGASALLVACGPKAEEKTAAAHPSDDWDVMEVVDNADDVVTDEDGFVWQTEQFGDIRLVRYQIPGWDNLEPRQKELAYYLTQAGYAGRDMMYDQRFEQHWRESTRAIQATRRLSVGIVSRLT
jgi:dipeptidyl-peptidase-3